MLSTLAAKLSVYVVMAAPPLPVPSNPIQPSKLGAVGGLLSNIFVYSATIALIVSLIVLVGGTLMWVASPNKRKWARYILGSLVAIAFLSGFSAWLGIFNQVAANVVPG
jgi:hypothetical protein